MMLPSRMQGRDFGPNQLNEIRSLLREHPEWSRYQLSRQLALRWDWRSPNGQLKDMAARTLLLKLAQRAWIELPPLVRASPTRSGRSPAPALGADWDSSPLQETLSELGSLLFEEVSGRARSGSRAQLEDCLHRHHYLGYQARVGENLQYWVRRADGRPLACVVFGAPAWQCAPRDRWIGWSAEQRAVGLAGIANNTRFLILPWVQVPQLASHILGAISRRVAADWAAKYHPPIHLLETFVERSRFRGTAYRAANWTCVGPTQGRGRQGPRADILSTSIKDIYLHDLHPGWRQSLCSPTPGGCEPNAQARTDSRAVPAMD